MLRFLSAGESHGKSLVGILEGYPKGVRISEDFINKELACRQSGFGRGKRMAIEKDKINILSGIRNKETLGTPISFTIDNRDNTIKSFSDDKLPSISVPRPGHADIVGFLKYGHKDIRNVLERSSARETASRVAAGSICKQLLGNFGIEVISHVVSVGKVSSQRKAPSAGEVKKKAKNSVLGCIDKKAEKEMVKEIEKAQKKGDSLGGVVEIIAEKVPPGLGSYSEWDTRLDSKLAQSLVSIPAVKGVEIGLGFEYTRKRGSESHDVINHTKKRGFYSKTNNSGGILGGISNGEPIVTRIAMKPIATLVNPLFSVDIKTKKKKKAPSIRSDTTAVTACGVIAESMVAFTLCSVFLDKFSSDSFLKIKKNYRDFLKSIQ